MRDAGTVQGPEATCDLQLDFDPPSQSSGRSIPVLKSRIRSKEAGRRCLFGTPGLGSI